MRTAVVEIATGQVVNVFERGVAPPSDRFAEATEPPEGFLWIEHETAGPGWALVDGVLQAPTTPLAPEPTPQELIAKMERQGIPEQKIDGGYIRGVREYMLGGAAMFNACNQIIEALEAKIREIGGPSYADFTAPRLPDIMQTPGMQKVKSLDDQIKALRAQI